MRVRIATMAVCHKRTGGSNVGPVGGGPDGPGAVDPSSGGQRRARSPMVQARRGCSYQAKSRDSRDIANLPLRSSCRLMTTVDRKVARGVIISKPESEVFGCCERQVDVTTTHVNDGIAQSRAERNRVHADLNPTCGLGVAVFHEDITDDPLPVEHDEQFCLLPALCLDYRYVHSPSFLRECGAQYIAPGQLPHHGG